MSTAGQLLSTDAVAMLEAAQLTPRELLLVSDVISQLVTAAGRDTPGQQQQQQISPAGLTAQLDSLLPNALHLPQQQHASPVAASARSQPKQIGLAQQSRTDIESPAAAARSIASSTSQAQAQPLLLHLPAHVADVTGLASPSSSSVSGRSSPASPRGRIYSRPATTEPQVLQPPLMSPSPISPHPGVEPTVMFSRGGSSSVGELRAPQSDAATQAAAAVLSAALADPSASVDDIVDLFDKVLSVTDEEAKALQQLLSEQQPLPWLQQSASQQLQQLPQQRQQQQPAAAARLAATGATVVPATAAISSTASNQSTYMLKQQVVQQLQGLQQQQKQQLPLLLQPPIAQHHAVQRAAEDGLLASSRSISPHSPVEVAAGLWSSRSAGYPDEATPSAQGLHPLLSADRGSIKAAATAAVPTSGAKAGLTPARAFFEQNRASGHSAAIAHYSRNTLSSAGRSISPGGAPQAANSITGERSCSPDDIERNWKGSLRGDVQRQSSRSRSSSPPDMQLRARASIQQQHQTGLFAAHSAAGRPLSEQGQGFFLQSCPGSPAAAAKDWMHPSRHSMSMGQPIGKDCEPQAEQPDSSKGHQQPLKLPQHELEMRMRRFYERNVDWKRRCALSYQRQRKAQEVTEVDGCTFAPIINKKSERIVQETGTRYPMRPIRPLTPMGVSCPSAQPQQQQQQRQQQRSASTGRAKQLAKQEGGQQEWLLSSPAGSRSVSPLGQNPRGDEVPAVAKRLFEDAVSRGHRAQQYKEVTKKAERQARSWSAPRCAANSGVTPRVYDHLLTDRTPPRNRAARSAVFEDFPFQPWTNPRARSRSPPVRSQQQMVKTHTSRAAAAGAATAAAAADGGGVAVKSAARAAAAAAAAASSAAAATDEADELQAEFEAAFDELVGCEGQQQDEACEEQTPRWPVPPAEAGPGHSSSRSRQQQQQGEGGNRIGSLSGNTDLNWDEFIQRQSRFESLKKAKVAALAANKRCGKTSPELSPGTKRILAEKQLYGSLDSYRSSSPASPSKGFLGKMEQQYRSQSGSGSAYGTCSSRAGTGNGAKVEAAGGLQRLSADCTFKPHISARASAKKPRPVEELSEGDRLRREVRLEQLRIMSEARDLAGATFRPDLSPSRQHGNIEYLTVPPRVRHSSGGLAAYMASLEEKRRQMDARREAAEKRRQEEEMRDCTFKPVTTPVPAYITQLADVGYTARYIDRIMQGAADQLEVTGAASATGAAAANPALGPVHTGYVSISGQATAAAASSSPTGMASGTATEHSTRVHGRTQVPEAATWEKFSTRY